MQLIRVPAKSSRAGDLTPPRAFHQVPPGVPVRASNVRSWPKRDVQRFGQRQAPSRDRATRDREPGTGYLACFQTSSTRPPAEPAAALYFSSSPETVKGRFWAVPSQLG